MSIRLTDPERDRYQRLRLIKWWDQERIQAAKILVLGAGALGNEVVKNLALLGIGEAWIMDFDRIETTNLTRSVLFRHSDVGRPKAEVLAERAAQINPDSKFHPLQSDARYDIGLGFLSRIDLVFGCLDNREARYAINRLCVLLRKRFIDGGLDTLNGSVAFFHPPETACYECTLEAADRAELQKRISCLYDPTPEIQSHVPTAPTIASIIGGMQVQLGLRALHELEVPSGKRIGMYGLSDVFFQIKLEISDDCGAHASLDPLPPRIQQIDRSENDPIRSILVVARRLWEATELTWDFDRDLITSLTCMSCSGNRTFVGTQNMYRRAAKCRCGGAFKPVIATAFTGQESWGNVSFRELGFPSDHVYCALTPSGRCYFQLHT